ncbi:helicase C-terminal domain-containing protein [Streptomyces sp. CA-288835]|uniref:helicase C-terminal domain-containing protein n=1 Tax=Streptomyces sp. CA-288835 TaxID=3240069 RepID=UPI003D8E8106
MQGRWCSTARILAPVALNPQLDPEAVRLLARQFANGDRDGDGIAEDKPVNVVVLVPSEKAAKAWENHADRTYRVGDLAVGVKELQAGHVGMVVLVNKYDGVDLPADVCRLLILDGIPRLLDAVERREAVALADSSVRLAREVQRIEQGMGRGVRDSEDYCAVLLLGANLGVAIHEPRHLSLFSPATQAQLKLSSDIARQIKGEGLNSVRQALRACLGRSPQWTERSRRALAEVRYAPHGTVRPEAVALREAFDLAATGRTTAAADRLQRTTNDLDDQALRGWLQEQKAAYLHMTDPVAAQQVLTRALDENQFVLKPAGGVEPTQIKAAAVQAREAAQFLAAEYGDGVNLVLGVKALLEEVVWGDEDRADDAERAWERLGRHLGFVSTRPGPGQPLGPLGRTAGRDRAEDRVRHRHNRQEGRGPARRQHPLAQQEQPRGQSPARHGAPQPHLRRQGHPATGDARGDPGKVRAPEARGRPVRPRARQ